MNAMLFDSLLTCPHCGHAKREKMPTDACLFFYQCDACLFFYQCDGCKVCHARRFRRNAPAAADQAAHALSGHVLHILQAFMGAPILLPPQQSIGHFARSQTQRVGDHAHRRQRHRRCRHHRRQENAEERVQHASRDRNPDDVVEEGKKEVGPDVFHRRLRKATRTHDPHEIA
eukprot:gene60546-82833_t